MISSFRTSFDKTLFLVNFILIYIGLRRWLKMLSNMQFVIQLVWNNYTSLPCCNKYKPSNRNIYLINLTKSAKLFYFQFASTIIYSVNFFEIKVIAIIWNDLKRSLFQVKWTSLGARDLRIGIQCSLTAQLIPSLPNYFPLNIINLILVQNQI